MNTTDVRVTTLASPPVAEHPLEVVERKGLGHPDTICDAVAEAASNTLSRYYLDHFGMILHHNVDKVLLSAGAARPVFGGGHVSEPMQLFLSGRVTRSWRGVGIPAERLVGEAVRAWIRDHLRYVDPENDVDIQCLFRPTSSALSELYGRRPPGQAPLANDTSCGVGYAPWSRLEAAVYDVEKGLNAPATKAEHPEIGEDVKVMGLRRGDDIDLTVACAMVDRHVRDLTQYQIGCAEVAALAGEAAGDADVPVSVLVNGADGETADQIYLTVTGTSAEAGDDGQAGRGNRANGLIAPYRPQSTESVAGKNPVTHVGKLYNLAADRIARACVAELDGVSEAYCYLVSRIGAPIDEPALAEIRIAVEAGTDRNSVVSNARLLVAERLGELPGWWRQLIGAPY